MTTDPRKELSFAGWGARGALCVLALLVSGAAGCGEGSTNPAGASEGTGASQGTGAFVALFEPGLFDYEPAVGPEQLAKGSDLVVLGRILEFASGRSFGEAGDPETVPNAVMKVAVDETIRGVLPSGSDGQVHVEFFGVEEPHRFNEAAPADRRTLLYLVQRDERSLIPGRPVTNAGAGRPKDQPLFAPATPQGFFLADPEGAIEVLEGIRFVEATLADLRPSAREFPEETAPVDAS